MTTVYLPVRQAFLAWQRTQPQQCFDFVALSEPVGAETQALGECTGNPYNERQQPLNLSGERGCCHRRQE